MKNMTIANKLLKDILPNPDQPKGRLSPAAMAKLIASIERHGILSPLFLRRIKGQKTLIAIDGNSRLEAVREHLGWGPNTSIRSIIVTMDDNEALVTGMIVNQIRERWSPLIELNTLRKLRSNGLTMEAAAQELCKSKSWCSKMLSVDNLPKRIIKKIDLALIPVAHGITMARYVDQPKIVAMLLKHSEGGNASVSILDRMAEKAMAHGIEAAEDSAPLPIDITRKSRGRAEPRQHGTRFEFNIHKDEDPKVISDRIAEIVFEIHRANHPKN